MKKVSVIIPVYNVQEYLKECLESIINQTYKKIEINIYCFSILPWYYLRH